MENKKTILWVEDDSYYKSRITPMLEVSGFRVVEASKASEAIDIFEAKSQQIDLVMLDVAMPHGGAFPELSSKAGHETGLLLGSWIHDRFPEMPIVGFSLNDSYDVRNWFQTLGAGYFQKGMEEWTVVQFIKKKLGLGHLQKRGPRVFIVHGHSDALIQELTDFLKSDIQGSEVLVLRDLPAQGRTIIEKFEQTAEVVDLVIVLLTPDDIAFPKNSPQQIRSRARQNVIFELGYFFAKLQRSKGRVIVLSHGDVERPTDIQGLEYINITNGLEEAREKMRTELSSWL